MKIGNGILSSAGFAFLFIGNSDAACNSGYRADGDICIDIDECFEASDNCSNQAHCYNTAGSFRCECWDGWTDANEIGSGDGIDNASGQTCTCESE